MGRTPAEQSTARYCLLRAQNVSADVMLKKMKPKENTPRQFAVLIWMPVIFTSLLVFIALGVSILTKRSVDPPYTFLIMSFYFGCYSVWRLSKQNKMLQERIEVLENKQVKQLEG